MTALLAICQLGFLSARECLLPASQKWLPNIVFFCLTHHTFAAGEKHAVPFAGDALPLAGGAKLQFVT